MEKQITLSQGHRSTMNWLEHRTRQGKNRVSIEGNIINVNQLQEYGDDTTKHGTQCGGSIIHSGECKDGFPSILTSHCSTYQHNIALETAKKVKGSRVYCREKKELCKKKKMMDTN